MSTKVKRLGIKYSVQGWNEEMAAWVETARFMASCDAIEFASSKPYRPHRVMLGRTLVASFPAPKHPSRDAAGDRAPGEGTGAPEH